MSYWYVSRIDRFADRDELTFNELFDQYFSHLDVPKECVQESLLILEEVYEIPIGRFRPTDTLEKFFDDPPKTLGFVRGVLDGFTSSIFESDVEDILEKRMKEKGTWKQWKTQFAWEFEKFTLEEFILAYCGKSPPTFAAPDKDLGV